MALSQRDWSGAKAESLKALSLSGTEFKTTIIEADYTYGLAQTFSGAVTDGRVRCEKAVTLATELRDAGRLSDALLALAEAMLQSGDSQGALTTSRRAQEMLAKLAGQDLEWLAWLITARASQKAGDENSAGEHAKRASDLLAGLEQKWGADNYGKYLTRPDIVYFRNQLSELVR
jgi:hypothetical protein